MPLVREVGRRLIQKEKERRGKNSTKEAGKVIRNHICYYPKLHIVHRSICIFIYIHSLNEIMSLQFTMIPQEL